MENFAHCLCLLHVQMILLFKNWFLHIGWIFLLDHMSCSLYWQTWPTFSIQFSPCSLSLYFSRKTFVRVGNKSENFHWYCFGWRSKHIQHEVAIYISVTIADATHGDFSLTTIYIYIYIKGVLKKYYFLEVAGFNLVLL